MISNILPVIDIFGVPALLNFSGKEKAKSQFGGTCSLLFSLFAIWVLYNGTRELFSSENPQTVVSEIYSQGPRQLVLSPSTFPIGVLITPPNSMEYRAYINPKIFNLTIQMQTYFKHNNTWTLETIPTANCTTQKLGEIYSTFSSSDLEGMFCLPSDNISVQGSYGSQVYQILLISLYECNNATAECASREEIDMYLKGGYIKVFYGNSVIDPTNYTDPNNQYQDFYNLMFGTATSKTTIFELRHLNVITDSGFLVEQFRREEFAKVNNIRESSDVRNASDPTKPLVQCMFTIGKLETTYARSYKKIQAVLAEVAGLLNTALLSLVVAISGFLKLKVRENLMNELFDLDLNYEPLNKRIKRSKAMKMRLQLRQDISSDNGEGQLDGHMLEMEISKQQPCIEFPGVKSTTAAPGTPEPEKKENSRCNDKKRESTLKSHHKPKASSVVIPSFNKNELELKNIVLSYKDLGVKWDKVQDDTLLSLPVGDRTDVKKGDLPPEKDEPVKIELGEIVDENQRENFEFENSILMPASPTNSDINGLKDKERVEHMRDFNREKKELKRSNTMRNEKKEEKEGPKFSEESVNLFRKHDKVTLSFWEYVMSFVYMPKHLRKKFKVLNEGRRNINLGLDVINIFKKMREVDKLKALLFDENQLILFNNLPKPEIRVNNKLYLNRSGSFAGTLIRKANLAGEFGTAEEALNSYNLLKEKTDKTELDKRLVEVFYESFNGREEK